MACIICHENYTCRDATEISQGSRGEFRGKVVSVNQPDTVDSPCKDLATVILQTDEGTVIHLKFKTQEEMDHWRFEPQKNYVTEGCLHIIDEKQLVFDVSKAVLSFIVDAES